MSGVDRVDLAGPLWAVRLESAANTSGPGLAALARLLDVETSPPALRELARAYLRPAPPVSRPLARPSDPATSKAAAERVRRPAGPGGKVHEILRDLELHARTAPIHARQAGTGTDGRTARELTDGSNLRQPIGGAWKRTAELLADGLLEVVRRVEYEAASGRWVDGAEVTRDGSRVLRITDAGRLELDRLNAAAGV